jgi:predicted Zn-dependent protease
MARDQKSAAERLARECVAHSPWVGEHHVRLGTCRLHQGRLDDAETFILRGIALGPAKPYFWAQLASVCQHAGRDEEARQHLAKAMELDPAHPWFRIQSSQLEQTAGRFDDSVGAARTAVELDPAIVVAHLRLIDALIRAGQFTDAEAALAAAKSRFPQDDEVARRGTRVLWIAGRADEARAQERSRMTANMAALAAGPARDDPRNRVADPDQRADLETRIERALHGRTRTPGTK